MDQILDNTIHYWAGNQTGLVMASNKEFIPRGQPKERFKYMGFTTDTWWPKKMNTGRLLHKPNYKTRKKNKKFRKLS